MNHSVLGGLIVLSVGVGIWCWLGLRANSDALTLIVARQLRRLGRWFWAAGEGCERGYRHFQKARTEIALELND